MRERLSRALGNGSTWDGCVCSLPRGGVRVRRVLDRSWLVLYAHTFISVRVFRFGRVQARSCRVRTDLNATPDAFFSKEGAIFRFAAV